MSNQFEQCVNCPTKIALQTQKLKNLLNNFELSSFNSHETDIKIIDPRTKETVQIQKLYFERENNDRIINFETPTTVYSFYLMNPHALNPIIIDNHRLKPETDTNNIENLLRVVQSIKAHSRR